MRSFLIAFLLLLWLILGWLFYQDTRTCCAEGKEVSALHLNKDKTGPILFGYNNYSPILGDGWPMMRDSIATFASDSTSLEILGWYCTNLTPPETEALGLARASSVRKQFSMIPDEHIILGTKAVQCDTSRISTKDEAVSFATRKRTANIKETADATLIYFPFNSTNKLNSNEVESYLNDVVVRVLKSGETVSLTGHTDNVGSDQANLALGQRRANIIRDYLISKGLSASKVKADSKGEGMPISDNNTEDGKAKNRRTELKIIP